MIRPLLFLFLLLYFPGQAQEGSNTSKQSDSTRAVELLQQYVRIPSESGQEAAAGEFLKEVCQNRGLYIREMGQEDGRYNFTASLFPLEEKRPNIVLLNHIDVVPESPENEHGPYSGVVENGYLYGRGSFDNKGMAVMLLEALSRIKSYENYQDSPYNISILSVSCEETQCEGGAQYVLSNFAEELNAAVVIAEGPTEISKLMDDDFPNRIFAISRAHKRAFWIELEIEIESFSHGSITPENYATKELIDALQNITKKKQKAIFNDINTGFLKEMAQYRKGIQKFVLKHPRFFKPLLVPKLRKTPELFSIFSNTVTLTNLNSSSQTVNVNSNVARAGIDCRLMPNADEKAFEQEIRKRLKNEKIHMKVVKTTPRNRPSSSENVFHKNLKSAILEAYPDAATVDVLMPNINDMGYFRAANIPAYGTIPVNLTKSEVESIHGTDERLPLKELEAGCQVYFIFLKKMIYEKVE